MVEKKESEEKIEFEGIIDTTIFKEVLSTLTSVVDQGILRFKEEGITSKSVNPEDVAMVSLDIKRDVFTDYDLKGEELAVGMDFGNLLNVLKLCSGDDTRIKINTEKAEWIYGERPGSDALVLRHKHKMQMSSGYLSYDLPLISLDALRSEPKLPKLEFSAMVTIELEDFKRGINTADTITDYVEIGVNSEEFFMGMEGIKGEFKGEFKLVIPKEDLTLFNADREVKSKFSTEYLTRMASGVVGRLITLKMNNAYPLQMPFKVTDGCEVVYLLAPRID